MELQFEFSWLAIAFLLATGGFASLVAGMPSRGARAGYSFIAVLAGGGFLMHAIKDAVEYVVLHG